MCVCTVNLPKGINEINFISLQCVLCMHWRNRELYAKEGKTQRRVVALAICERLTIVWFFSRITTLEINATVCNNMRDVDAMLYVTLLTINWDLFAIIFYYFIRCIWKKCARRHLIHLIVSTLCVCACVWDWHTHESPFVYTNTAQFCICTVYTGKHSSFAHSLTPMYGWFNGDQFWLRILSNDVHIFHAYECHNLYTRLLCV